MYKRQGLGLGLGSNPNPNPNQLNYIHVNGVDFLIAAASTDWRENAAWLEGVDADEGEPRERAVEEGKRVKEGFEALATRRRKYPQFPIADVAFSSDDEA